VKGGLPHGESGRFTFACDREFLRIYLKRSDRAIQRIEPTYLSERTWFREDAEVPKDRNKVSSKMPAVHLVDFFADDVMN
jgi:hypothetical protein